MKKRTRVIFISVIGIIIVLSIATYVYVTNRINNYIEASKPKITEDINESESAFLQDQFGTSLPPGAEIAAFSYSHEVIIIRIEGVEDLPNFLTDSIYPGVAEEEAEIFTEDYYGSSERNTYPLTDMYGIEHQCWGICPIDSITTVRFFLLDEKLTIEIMQRYYVTKNLDALRDIVDKSM